MQTFPAIGDKTPALECSGCQGLPCTSSQIHATTSLAPCPWPVYKFCRLKTGKKVVKIWNPIPFKPILDLLSASTQWLHQSRMQNSCLQIRGIQRLSDPEPRAACISKIDLVYAGGFTATIGI